jgi:AraC-like DNA-binding protein
VFAIMSGASDLEVAYAVGRVQLTLLVRPVDPSALQAVFAQAANREGKADESIATGGERMARMYVRLAIDIIEREHMEPDLTVQSMSRRVGVSADYLSRLFKRYVGVGPLGRLHSVRVATAARLLAETGQSVKEIATRSGYHSSGALDVHFRRNQGCTPSTYRARRAGHGPEAIVTRVMIGK